VVIPVFNAQATLGHTLQSLSEQHLTDWEALVVDDGSSDASVEVAQRLADRDSRIRVLCQTHGGASSARNLGVEQARGTWLVLLDADDWLAPDHLARLSEALDAHDAAIACCDHVRVRPDGGHIAVESCAVFCDQPFEVLARRSAGAIHSFMVRRDLVLEVGGFDANLSTCDDWDLWQRLARIGARFVAVPEILAFYRSRYGSLSGERRRMLQNAIEVISRGHRRDPRVRTPLPKYADGIDDGARDECVALFAVWCAAAEAARGEDPSSLLEDVPQFPDLSHRLEAVCDSIQGGMIVGGQLLPEGVPAAWPRTCARLVSMLARLESASHRGFSYQVRSTIERRIVAAAPLHEPIALTLWMGIRVDLRRPFTTIAPSPNIDVVECRICAGEVLLGTMELPVFGAIPAGDLARAVVDFVGWRTAVTHGRLLRRRRFWTALMGAGFSAAPEFGGAVASRMTSQPRGLRRPLSGVVREATRRALMGTDDATSVASSDSRAAQIAFEARAGALATCPEPAPQQASPHPRNQENETKDLKTYFEKTFETPDPWGYENIYETQKYAQTIALLDDESIDRALELGCAEGHFTRQLAPRVRNLIAADISERALERARERCRTDQNIEFRQLDFFSGAVPRGMDLIVCSEVLYFLGNAERLAVVARAIADALADGGRLLTAHAFLLADDPSRTGFDWEQPFGAATIADAFLAAGLRLEKSVRTDLYRVDLFRRGALHESSAPSIRYEPFGSPLPPKVERGVVWGGAVVRRADVAATDTIQVPVLLYHRVADDGPRSLADYCVPPSLFEEQMRFLRRHGFHTVTSADVEQHRRERRPMRGRPVLITFDDGYRDFFDVAWPILRRFGFTAEVFLPTDHVGGTAGWDSAHGAPADLMNWDHIQRAHAEGVRFGSHLASHASAAAMDSETLLLEGVRSRAILEQRLGCDVRSVAPPYGACDERIVRVLQSCGFTQIFTTDPELATMDRWSPTVPRIAISGQDGIETFAARLGAAAFDPGAADAPLVTAVVPAYNAEKTIDETLRSVRAQTYRNLEILVVDDGSTDRTAAVVEAHASADPRVRLIRQANAGVAAARNRGISESAADFVAPVDADDLWMPTKIEKQMVAMRARGPRCGLVYTWQTTIDEHGRAMSHRRRWECEGYVLPRMLYGNLVGSGSPALMRKEAVIEAGGYDASLRERGAQGCEDFQLYLRISERYEFAVIKEHLTGYRELHDAMSTDFLQMVRSDELVGAYAERAHPRHARLIRAGRIYFRKSQIRRALRHGRFRTAGLLLLGLLRSHPWHALTFLVGTPHRALRLIAPGVTATANDAESGRLLPFLPPFTSK
jgi:glycosyltransferase involved in cell wall biosynthesis/peptidoglycan/xylan/chitin deacetylase (PgdA/CDA1 family)